ncbi:MAG TPA: MFS transporter [Amnibacterium sp.]
MLAPYRRILAHRGALAFSALGLFARMEMAMVGLGSVLLVQRTTGSYALGGAAAGTFGLASALASPAVARLADRLGQARLLRIAAPIHALLLLAIVLTAVLGAPIAVVLVATALAGVSQVNVGSLVRARWALIVDGRDLQVAFAFESVLDEVVFVVGPIIVTLLAALVHPAVGLLLAAVTAVAGALLLARQGRTQPPIGDGSPHPEHERGPVLRMRGMLVLVAVFFAAGGVFGSAEVAVAAVTKAAGVPAAAGLVLALWATGSMLGGLVYGAVHWRGRMHRRFAAVAVVLAVLTAPMALVPPIPLLAVVFLFAGIAIAPVIATGSTLVETLVPRARLTEGLAWTNTALSLTYALSAGIAGAVIDRAGPGAGFLVPTVAAAAVGVFALIGLPRLVPRGELPGEVGLSGA